MRINLLVDALLASKMSCFASKMRVNLLVDALLASKMSCFASKMRVNLLVDALLVSKTIPFASKCPRISLFGVHAQVSFLNLCVFEFITCLFPKQGSALARPWGFLTWLLIELALGSGFSRRHPLA